MGAPINSMGAIAKDMNWHHYYYRAIAKDMNWHHYYYRAIAKIYLGIIMRGFESSLDGFCVILHCDFNVKIKWGSKNLKIQYFFVF